MGASLRGWRHSSAVAAGSRCPGREGSRASLPRPMALRTGPRTLDLQLFPASQSLSEAPHLESSKGRGGMVWGQGGGEWTAGCRWPASSGAYSTDHQPFLPFWWQGRGTRNRGSPWAQASSLAHLPHPAGRPSSSAHHHPTPHPHHLSPRWHTGGHFCRNV